jgi:hypothetical protein
MLSTKLDWSLANPKWASELNPIIGNPMTNMRILPNVTLATGNNVINHGLGKTQQGWVVIDIQGAATIYRDAPFNNTTLTLHASAGVIVSLGVF